MENKPKFCINCNHCAVRKTEHGTAHACIHPKSIESKGVPVVNVVTGKEIDLFDRARMCGTMREFDGLCGPEAKYFEPK